MLDGQQLVARFFKEGWTLNQFAVNKSIHKWANLGPQTVNSIDLTLKNRICDVIVLYFTYIMRHKTPIGANLVSLLFRKCPTFIY